MKLSATCLAFAALTTTGADAAALSCMGDDGKAVDHFTMFKEPNSGNYLLSIEDSGLIQSKHDISNATGSLGNTLLQLYNGDKKDIGFAMYNDQGPDGQQHASPHAHAKGVLAFNDEGGFWIIHSVPKFAPFYKDGYDGCCSTGLKFGQSFRCLTLSVVEINRIGRLEQIEWSYVHDSNLPSSLEDVVPDFANWIDGGRDKENMTAIEVVKTRGGDAFTVFAKSGLAGDDDNDLYEEEVADHFSTNLAVESWQNGRGSMSSSCKSDGFAWDVMNGDTLDFADVSGPAWTINQDHSKWAIAQNDGKAPKSPIVCVGGINRQTSQESRGGGTACRPAKKLWSDLDTAMKTIEECK